MQMIVCVCVCMYARVCVHVYEAYFMKHNALLVHNKANNMQTLHYCSSGCVIIVCGGVMFSRSQINGSQIANY